MKKSFEIIRTYCVEHNIHTMKELKKYWKSAYKWLKKHSSVFF